MAASSSASAIPANSKCLSGDFVGSDSLRLTPFVTFFCSSALDLIFAFSFFDNFGFLDLPIAGGVEFGCLPFLAFSGVNFLGCLDFLLLVALSRGDLGGMNKTRPSPDARLSI